MGQTIDNLLERLIVDVEFRTKFERDRGEALASYELSDSERAGMVALDADRLADSARFFAPPCVPNVPI